MMLANWSKIVSHLLSTAVQITEATPLGGGCISEVYRLETTTHGPLVVKRNTASMVSNFRCEAAGLRAISVAKVIRVPEVRAVDEYESQAYLLLEDVSSPLPAQKQSLAESFGIFGRQLARFHRQTGGTEMGWLEDNFLGAAKQMNTPASTWDDFVAENRLGFQLRWLVDQGLADARLQSDVKQIVERLGDLLRGREDRTSLLHGDLWSGNYLFDASGAPVLIDPAVYRGCREAEWGMINWFGSCPPAFEEAYLAEWPMPSGWRRRAMVYMLYHQLNHLNLFGAGYRSGCQQLAGKILSA